MIEVPDWSGKLVEVQDSDIAVMAIHVSDPRTHRAPSNYSLVDIEVDGDEEVFTYRRTA